MPNFRPFLFIFLFSSCAAQASITPYFDKDDWLSALSSTDFEVEAFNGDSTKFQANSVGNTLSDITVSLLGGEGDPGPTGMTGKGFFQGEVDSSGADKLSIEIGFENAFGFALEGLQNDSLSNPGNLSLGEIAITIESESWVLKELTGQEKSDIPFLGFVSDDAINSFQFIHARLLTNKGGTSEEFYLDQLTLALAPEISQTQPGSPPSGQVPEPPIFLLLVAGLMGLFSAKSLRSNLR
jgi:hypothetical protein